MNNVDDHTRSY